MNRVYKVIWSKAKHCYVVTSEIAKSVTKSASSARSAGRKGAAVLAMAALLFTAGGVLGEAAYVTEIHVKPGSSTADVIEVKTDDEKTTDITINDVYHAITATSDRNGLVIDRNYVKNADAEVEAGGTYVKVDNTVGQNLSALDTNLSALDTQVKANAKDNLKVGNDGVISQVTGDDGTTSSPVNKLVLNKDGDNQITMDEKGIKVGTNSTVIASDGVFAGGGKAAAAKAALNADGSIKGANGQFAVGTDGSIRGADGNFKVNADGKVTANGGVDTDGGDILTRNGKINAGSGDISGKDITASGNLHADGDISGKDITGSGTVTGHALTDGTARMEGGALTGVTTITATGNISTGGDVVSTGGKVQGTSVSDGTATLSGGSLTGAVNIDASGTITGNNVVVKDKLTTKNLEVTDGLKTDHITLGSETNNYTDINKGNVTSKVHEIDGAVEYTAVSVFKRDGSSITARTDEGAVDSTGISKVGANEISQYLGDNAKPESSQKNVTRNMVRNDDGTFRLEDKVVDKDGNKSSIVSQNAGERKVELKEGTKTLTVTENLTGGIVSETKGDDGTVTLTQGMNGTYMVETSGTSTEEIGGQKIENYKDGLKTEITGDETHHVTENQTNTVDGTLEETVKGKVTEDYQDALETTVGKDETHYVKGNQTNTVDGTLEETVKENVTEVYQKDLSTTVGGNQTTTVTGDSSLSAKNITNTAEGGTIYNKSKDILNEASEDILNFADGEIGNVATKITNITGDNTVTSDTDGTTFVNTGANTPMEDGNEHGSRTDTKIKGNTVETGKVMTDFADVNNNLTVGGSTTLGRDGNTTLTVKSKSTFEDTVKMEKTLEVDGTSTFNEKVTITKGGLAVTGGTTTDTLNVTGETRTGTLHVKGDGYVDGDLNVKGNIETHDAELSADSRQVVTGRQLYQTNERVDKLDNRIKKVGANAAALAALRPGDFNPDDKFSIAAGFGSYRNASAAALGLFYRPNENVILSLGTSFGDGENMVNAGVSVKFGRGKSMAERRKEMAEEVSVMRNEMKSQNDRIAELEEMLKKQSELIEKLSKES